MSRRSAHSGPALLLRHLAAHPAGGLTVAVLVVLLSALAAAAPRAVEAMHTRSLDYAVSALEPAQRDITGAAIGVPDPGASAASGPEALPAESQAAWGGFNDRVVALHDSLPSPLREATGRPQYFLSQDSLPITRVGDENYGELALAYDPRASEHVRYTDGSPPSDTDDDVVEIGLATVNADILSWGVGETRQVQADRGETYSARLSGVFEPVDPDDDYWSHAPLLLEPSLVQEPLGPPVYTVTGLVDSSELPALAVSPTAVRVEVWFPLDPAAVTQADAPALVEQLRRLESAPPTVVVTRNEFFDSMLSFSAGPADTIEDTLTTDAAVDAVLAMTASGPLGVMIAVLLLGCRMISGRRADALRLLAARGASGGTLRGIMAIEGLVIGVPAAIVGSIVGILVTTGPITAGALLLAVLLGLLPAVLLALPAPDLRRGERDDLDGASRASGRVRIIVELVVVGLAAVATFALVQRGLTTAAAASGIDPLLAAAPLLLALAVCVAALRLYPLPLAWLARRSHGRRGLSAYLGPVRALRDPATGLAPVLALVVGVAVAVSSGVLLTTIRSGIDDAAVTAVGADLRVKGTPLTTEQVEEIGAVPGVADAAAVSGANSALIDVDGRRTNTSIIVVDTEALGRVQGDAPGALPVGSALRADGDTVPVVASGATTAAVGTSADATLDGEPITIVATVDGSTALSTRANWAIVDSRFADRVGVANPVTHVMLLRLKPGADLEATRAAVQDVAGDAATVDTPAASAAVLASTPAAAGLQSALLIAIAVTALLSALTIAMTLVLGGPARARILVLLRMLGGARREARSLAVWEIAPMAVVALVFGAALGIGLPLVILAGVDLRGFTGGRLQPALAVDPVLTLALVLGFALVTAVCTIIALFASGRARASSILRTVEA